MAARSRRTWTFFDFATSTAVEFIPTAEATAEERATAMRISAVLCFLAVSSPDAGRLEDIARQLGAMRPAFPVEVVQNAVAQGKLLALRRPVVPQFATVKSKNDTDADPRDTADRFLKEEYIDWVIWIELDPDDPAAQDDEVILLDSWDEEVQRVHLSSCGKDGYGVRVVFKNIWRDDYYTLIRDYGPNDGGGTDTLFIGRAPRDMDHEARRLNAGK